jgi:Na+-transporting methylmalonyl-CoA/oxaloacetate decarboxylase gamma subunit
LFFRTGLLDRLCTYSRSNGFPKNQDWRKREFGVTGKELKGMYVNDSSTGLVKLAFLSILLIAALTFCGGLAFADTGLFNWQMQKAEADALIMQAQIQAERDARQLPYIEEMWSLENDRRRLQYELEMSALMAEAIRIQNFRQNRDMIILSVGGLAGVTMVLIVGYVLLRQIGQVFERRAPSQRPSHRASEAATESTVAQRNGDPGARHRPTVQPAYLRRKDPRREPALIVQDVASYQHQNDQSGNGQNGRRVP